MGFLLTGCSPAYYKKSANKQVYGIINGSKLMKKSFTIVPPKPTIKFSNKKEKIIGLRKALLTASQYSRDYQYQKEQVYLTALTLTSIMPQYSPGYKLPDITGQSVYENNAGTKSINSSANLSLFQWLAEGTQFSLNITTNYLKGLAENPTKIFSSILTLNILQPLFQGAGKTVFLANLTQAERNVVYQIRNFLEYQRSFSVSIATSYLNLVEQKAIVLNDEKNYKALVENTKMSEMLYKAGQVPFYQVSQAKQQELSAHNSLLQAQTNYKEALDGFKIQLGIPVKSEIAISDNEVKKLSSLPLPILSLGINKALSIGLKKRLDLMNSEGAVVDAKRDVVVAKSNLRTNLSLIASTSIPTSNTSASDFQSDNGSYNGGVQFNLPTNRLTERNEYMGSLISLARAKRNYSLVKNNVILQIKNDYKNLQQAEKSYEILKKSYELEKRNIKGTTLLFEAGRASQLDILNARTAYIEAQNGFISAKINYLIAYLQFLTDTETLKISSSGVWNGKWNNLGLKTQKRGGKNV